LTFNQLSAAEKALVTGTVGSTDLITFFVIGTINLGSDLPTINKKLTIEAPGADKLTIDGVLSNRPVSVGAAGDLTLSGIRVYRGHDIDSGGGAINNGKLTLDNV